MQYFSERVNVEYFKNFNKTRDMEDPIGLNVVDCKRTDAAMSQEEIDKWMLEYEIIYS